MSAGKLAAQVAHAAVKGVDITRDMGSSGLISDWNRTGHTKIVLAARDAEHLLSAERYLAEQGILGSLIIDEGRTEVLPLTPTAIGFELVDKDLEKIKFAFSTFKLYKDSNLIQSSAKPSTRRTKKFSSFLGHNPS